MTNHVERNNRLTGAPLAQTGACASPRAPTHWRTGALATLARQWRELAHTPPRCASDLGPGGPRLSTSALAHVRHSETVGRNHAMAVGYEILFDKQIYRIIEVRPYVNRWGYTTCITVWETKCPDCGESFRLSSGSRRHFSKRRHPPPRRRCDVCKHPGKRVSDVIDNNEMLVNS